MPLAEARHNNLTVPLRLPLLHGKKPESLLELMGRSQGDCSPPEPLRMSAQQKSSSVDLALYRFAQAQSGNRFDPTRSTHSTFIRKSSVRRMVGDYTSAVIEGMCITKELSEDKLYVFMEFNFDKINLKDSNQSHVDLIKTMQLHASPTLTAIPGVQEAFKRLKRTLSKLLVPHMNALALRRGYSPDHQAMVNPLSIDPEVAEDDFASDDDCYYLDPTLDVDLLHPEQVLATASANTVAFPPSHRSVAACDSIISERLSATDFELGPRRTAMKYQEKGTETPKARGKTKAITEPGTPTAVYNANGEVLGTFTPLRPSQQRTSSPPFAQSSRSSHSSASTYQLVQLAGASANQGEASNLRPLAQTEHKGDYDVLSHVRPSLHSHSDSNSSKPRISKFRPSRQTGQGRSPGY